MSEPFDPEELHGVTFLGTESGRLMRYIFPDAGHWTAGWIVTRNPSGEWMTLRKATSEDVAVIFAGVIVALQVK